MKYEPLLKHLLNYDDIVIQVHHNPDADAIASGFSLCRYLEKNGKKPRFIYAGERYNQQENIKYNYMQPWYTSDLSLSKEFKIKRVDCRVMLEVNNVFSQDYDVILNYPMPKRNYGITFDMKI